MSSSLIQVPKALELFSLSSKIAFLYFAVYTWDSSNNISIQSGDPCVFQELLKGDKKIGGRRRNLLLFLLPVPAKSSPAMFLHFGSSISGSSLPVYYSAVISSHCLSPQTPAPADWSPSHICRAAFSVPLKHSISLVALSLSFFF